jgi:glutamyl-tRNA reductase
MALMTFGINYQTANLALREKLALDPIAIERVLQSMLQAPSMLQDPSAKEVLVLCTCNRTELYCHAEELGPLLQSFSDSLALNMDAIMSSAYSYQDEQAVRHLMSVASGLNSMVLGEVEILGQVKSAFRLAQKLGTVGKFLSRLFQTTFAVAKQVRSQTGISVNPLSVAGIAVKLAQRIFTDITKATVLLVGAGDLIRLTGVHLKEAGVSKIIIANRDLARASNLASMLEMLDAEAIKLEEIKDRLCECDIVITGTGSPLPLLGKGMIEKALKKRKRRSMFMIDLAMPRDIEPEVSELEEVYLYGLDDLQSIVQENRHKREQESKVAEHIILKEAKYFMQWYQAQDSVGILKSFRKRFEVERDQVLMQGLEHLKKGKSPEAVLQQAMHHMTNRLLHTPTKRLRQAGYAGEQEVLKITRELFELE